MWVLVENKVNLRVGAVALLLHIFSHRELGLGKQARPVIKWNPIFWRSNFDPHVCQEALSGQFYLCTLTSINSQLFNCHIGQMHCSGFIPMNMTRIYMKATDQKKMEKSAMIVQSLTCMRTWPWASEPIWLNHIWICVCVIQCWRSIVRQIPWLEDESAHTTRQWKILSDK